MQSAVRAVRHALSDDGALNTGYGGVACVALCVGRSQRAPAEETEVDVDRAAMEVNFHGPVAVAKHALGLLKESPPGASPAGGHERGRFLVLCSK